MAKADWYPAGEGMRNVREWEKVKVVRTEWQGQETKLQEKSSQNKCLEGV